MLNLAEERKKYLNKNVNDKTNTQYTKILPWKPKPRKPTFLEHSALLFSYSFRIKGYISNLGPHRRHNRHHTLILTQEQPCSQFNLHLHDQQPLRFHLNIIFYRIKTHLVYRIYSRKNPKEKAPKNGYKSIQIIGYKSWESGDSITVEYHVGLPIEYYSAFIRLPQTLLSTSCRLTSLNLPGRATSNF
jgi:hypothetical protein